MDRPLCFALLAWLGVVLVIFVGITIVLRIESRHGGGAAEPGPTSKAQVEEEPTQRVPWTLEWPVVLAFMITLGCAIAPIAWSYAEVFWATIGPLAVIGLLVWLWRRDRKASGAALRQMARSSNGPAEDNQRRRSGPGPEQPDGDRP